MYKHISIGIPDWHDTHHEAKKCYLAPHEKKSTYPVSAAILENLAATKHAPPSREAIGPAAIMAICLSRRWLQWIGTEPMSPPKASSFLGWNLILYLSVSFENVHGPTFTTLMRCGKPRERWHHAETSRYARSAGPRAISLQSPCRGKTKEPYSWKSCQDHDNCQTCLDYSDEERGRKRGEEEIHGTCGVVENESRTESYITPSDNQECKSQNTSIIRSRNHGREFSTTLAAFNQVFFEGIRRIRTEGREPFLRMGLSCDKWLTSGNAAGSLPPDFWSPPPTTPLRQPA
jgi:hypothetical protein